ncbi:MAG: hypothetical protein OEU80_12195 [Deltaproteobacteria bacterium]|nr:hypothetical protein [Deltaproteobacteria bacterium]
MAVLPGVLGCRPLRRTFRHAWESRGNAGRLPGTRRKRLRCAWHAHLRGLATAIHEIFGLCEMFSRNVGMNKMGSEHDNNLILQKKL